MERRHQERMRLATRAALERDRNDGPKPEDPTTMMTANELNEIYRTQLEALAPSAGPIRHMLAETRRPATRDVDAGPAGLGVVRPAPAPPQHYSLHEAAVHQL